MSDTISEFDRLCENIEIIFPEKMEVKAVKHYMQGFYLKECTTLGKVATSDMDDWQKSAVGMRLAIKYKGSKYEFDYWIGLGNFECVYPNRPRYGNEYTMRLKDDAITPGSLMWALLADHYSADCDFEGFCYEFGYDSDSRKAEKIYHATQEQARQMRRLLGSDLPKFLKALENQDKY